MWVDNDRWRGRAVPDAHRQADGRRRPSGSASSCASRPDAPFDVPKDGGVLTLSLAGNGAVELSMVVKEPGPGLDLTASDATIVLGDVEGSDALPPYVRLIHDVLIGDRSLFTRPDGLASAWEVLEPVLENRPAVQPYQQGSWGPADAARAGGSRPLAFGRVDHRPPTPERCRPEDPWRAARPCGEAVTCGHGTMNPARQTHRESTTP